MAVEWWEPEPHERVPVATDAIRVTPAAREVADGLGVDLGNLIWRHCNADWADQDEIIFEANWSNLDGGAVWTRHDPFWIATVDRQTTVMLADEGQAGGWDACERYE